MIGYYHYFGDYARDTHGLNLTEHGAYRILIDWYYLHERPIPSNWSKETTLGKGLQYKQRLILGQVLNRFFELKEDGWHQKRIDSEINRHQENAPAREERRLKDQQRLRAGRTYRRELFKALDQADCRMPWNTKTVDLVDMLGRLNLPLPDDPRTSKTLKPVQADTAVQVAAEANTCSRVPSPSPSFVLNTSANTAGVQVSASASICREVRKLGFASANPSDPALEALLAAGATLADFRSAAAQALAIKASNPWAYMLATVKGRRKDAQEGPKSGRGCTNAELFRAMVPGIVSEAPRPDFSDTFDVVARRLD